MSIPFSVAAAQRTGQFTTNAVVNPGGFTQIYWELNIPNQAEYENPANEFLAELFIDGVNWSQGSGKWVGGVASSKSGQVDPPPARKFDISGVQVGQTMQVVITLTGTFTIGIQNGLIS